MAMTVAIVFIPRRVPAWADVVERVAGLLVTISAAVVTVQNPVAVETHASALENAAKSLAISLARISMILVAAQTAIFKEPKWPGLSSIKFWSLSNARSHLLASW